MSRTEVRSISKVGHRTTAKMSRRAGPIQGRGPRSGSRRRRGVAGCLAVGDWVNVATPVNQGGDPGLVAGIPAC